MSLSIRPTFCALCAIIASYGCKPSNEQQTNVKASQVSKQPKDLASARKGFVTKLTVHGPAPQDYTDDEPPPRVSEVHFRSGDLDLKGWLSNDAANGNKRPAVVFLHGGGPLGETAGRMCHVSLKQVL